MRMVNLSCRKCGMSLDVSADDIASHCPNCGTVLSITVPQMIDILNDKKEIKRKGLKYSTQVTGTKIRAEKKKKRNNDIWIMIFPFLLAVLYAYLRFRF